MSVLFDLTSTQPSRDTKYHGGGDYTQYLFYKAIEKGYTNFEVIYYGDKFIDEKIVDTCQQNSIKTIQVTAKEDIKKYIEAHSFSKFYSALPYFYSDFNFDHTLFVFTIHGVRDILTFQDRYERYFLTGKVKMVKHYLNHFTKEKLVKQEQFKDYNGLLKIQNKKVITVSDNTKYLLLSLFPYLKNEELEVCYSPLNLSDMEIISEKSNYFLLISANRWIKNNLRAVKALDNLITKGLLPNKNVIVLGVNGYSKIKKVRNKDCFTFLDYVSNEELETYFKKAYCFIYPSLNEGFGYPPVQAMKHGTPVIASGVSSIPEVCKDAVSYFDPYSIPEMEARILEIASNLAYYQELQKKGLKRAKQLKDNQDFTDDRILNVIFGEE